MSEEPENLLCALFAADRQSVSHPWLTIGIGVVIEDARGIDRRHNAMMHCLRKISESEMLLSRPRFGARAKREPMAKRLTPRSGRWLQWVSGLLLIAAGGAQPVAMAAAAPQIPAGEARIWFYQYHGHRGAELLIPTVVANGTYVGPAPPRTVFYRDVLPGHYDITIPDPHGFKFGSAHFDLAAGRQAFVKILYWRLPRYHDQAHGAPGFTARLVPEQVAQAEFANLIRDGGQR